MIVSHHAAAGIYSGPLEEQSVLLTIEPFLQPAIFLIIDLWREGTAMNMVEYVFLLYVGA